MQCISLFPPTQLHISGVSCNFNWRTAVIVGSLGTEHISGLPVMPKWVWPLMNPYKRFLSNRLQECTTKLQNIESIVCKKNQLWTKSPADSVSFTKVWIWLSWFYPLSNHRIIAILQMSCFRQGIVYAKNQTAYITQKNTGTAQTSRGGAKARTFTYINWYTKPEIGHNALGSM